MMRDPAYEHLTVSVLPPPTSATSVPSPFASPPQTANSSFEQPYDEEIDENVDEEYDRASVDDAEESDDDEPLETLAYRHRQARENLNDLTSVSPTRLVTIMENKEISAVSLHRVMYTWRPKPDDVIVVGAGVGGESVVTRMVRLLSASSTNALGHVLENTVLAHAPVIESCVYDDEGMKHLNGDQAPFDRRVFRTSLTYRAMQERVEHAGKVKYVVVARHPVDARITWFGRVRRIYAHHLCDPRENIDVSLQRFDSRYIPDDFIKSPGVHLHNRDNLAQYEDDYEAYEANLADWVRHVQSSSSEDRAQRAVLVLFLEEILAQPEKAMIKLANHLGYNPSCITPALLDNVTGLGLLRIPACARELTRDQRRYLKLRYLSEANGGVGEVPTTTVGRHAWSLKSRMQASSILSSRGVYSAERPPVSTASQRSSLFRRSRGNSTSSACQSETSSRHIEDHLLSPSSVGELRSIWQKLNKARGGHLKPSYEELYKKMTGDAYPYAESDVPEAESMGGGGGRSSRANSLLSPFSSLKRMMSSSSKESSSSLRSSVRQSGDSVNTPRDRVGSKSYGE